MKVLLVILLVAADSAPAQWLLPVNVSARSALSDLRLTPIGRFGILRKARKGIPAHLHTGIDIKRPGKNYHAEPVFPASKGIVISLRSDGPFSQIIIEHKDKMFGKLWTVYEHVGGIRCTLGQTVFPGNAIARFFSREELDRHGWQFDHLHFEIMKYPPPAVLRRDDLPYRRFTTYALTCYTENQLHTRLLDPILFFSKCL